jgi:hypothetical protein
MISIIKEMICVKFNEELGMLEFDKKKVVGRVNIPLELTEADIESIIVNGFEGGINYWATFRKNDNQKYFAEKPKTEPISTWATKVLLEGHEVFLRDIEEEGNELLVLTLEKIIEGYRKNYVERQHDNDLDKGDATTCDCIIQYALFSELVYG